VLLLEMTEKRIDEMKVTIYILANDSESARHNFLV
jgi:hypothetical protein